MAWTDLTTQVAHTPGTAAWANQVKNNFTALTNWSSWTPTVTQSGAVTKTVNLAKYISAGKLVIARAKLTMTGSGTGFNPITISLPVTSATTGEDVGSGALYDLSTTTTYPGLWQIVTSTTISMYRTDVSFTGFAGQDPNIALASGDILRFDILYEAA